MYEIEYNLLNIDLKQVSATCVNKSSHGSTLFFKTQVKGWLTCFKRKRELASVSFKQQAEWDLLGVLKQYKCVMFKRRTFFNMILVEVGLLPK